MNLAYIRTSTKEQEPQLQIADIEKLCINGDFTLFQEKLSAWKENVKRPVFSEVVYLIKTGKVNHLYVWDLDRIYRNRLRLKEFFQLCKIHNTKIHSVSQQWLEELNKIPAPFNDMVFDLLISLFGWIGEEESTKKSARIKMALVQKEGSKTISYKGKKWGRKSLPKQTINRVLELYGQGKSIRQIASLVMVYDKNNHGKNISTTSVFRTITEFENSERSK